MNRKLAACALLSLCLALCVALFSTTASAQLTFNPAWALDGGQNVSAFGASVAGAGDVNGDGFDDVIVGAPSASNGETWEGQAYVYFGSATGPSTTPSWTAESDVAFAFFGAAVAGAGDVNGDGYDDVLVGAPQYANNQGRAYLYLGSATGLSSTAAWVKPGLAGGGHFGETLAGAGDLNGDGFDDVAIGSYLDSSGGHVYVFHGRPTGLLTSPSKTLASPQTQAGFGHGLAGAGDVNGDGFDDLIVGAHTFTGGEPGEGAAFVYLGSPTGIAIAPAWTAENDVASSQFGESVAGAGDLDGDGYDDVAVGAPLYDDGVWHEGRVYVYRGSASGLELQPAASPRGDQTSKFGWSLASAGDVNADGYADLLVGADDYSDAPVKYTRGRSFVFLGSAAGISELPDWYGWVLSTDAYVGASVDGAFDCNGDGFDDIIAGGMNTDSGAQHAQVHLGGHFGAASPYGRGKPLSSDVYAPRLMSFAPPKLGGTASLDFGGGTPFASPVFLFAGFQPAALPFDQGTLLVVPFTIAFLPQLPGNGAFSLPVHLPSTPAAQGLDLYLQAGFVDPAAAGAHHTVLSNGLHWVLGG